MSLMLTRMFAYFTLVCYLVVGTVVVRFCADKDVKISLSTSYLEAFSNSSMETVSNIALFEVPKMEFSEVKIASETKPIQKTRIIQVKKTILPDNRKIVGQIELPFHEIIKESPVIGQADMPVTMSLLYDEYVKKEVIVAEKKVETKIIVTEDQVSTKLASAEKTESVIEEEVVAELVEETKEEAPAVVKVDEVVSEPEFFDYPAKASAPSTQTEKVKLASLNDKPTNDLVAFDFKQVQKDIQDKAIPTVSASSPKLQKKVQHDYSSAFTAENKEKIPVNDSYPVSLSIHALGADLSKTEELNGFEVKFQDNLSESLEDYGSGEIKFEAELNHAKMTRSVTFLKRGYVPTSSEIILEEGTGSISIPLIEEEVLNNLNSEFERNGPVGSLLVELDDETELAKLDVPFGNVIKLNGDLKKTENEDFRYQLFIGVKSGNAMVSYHKANREVVTKIIHVHENELTYDANYYEEIINEKIKLYEEDLLSKENAPLIISAENVRVFATNRISKKISNNTYKLDFGSTNLAGRRYIELNNQQEPIFIGIRDNSSVSVPSENFMRFILSGVEGTKLGNRCLVQVNLENKIKNFDVASESVGASLMIQSQALDSDGKFYDSVSEKTKKLIIVGESHSSSTHYDDAKINIKIEYENGSEQYLSTYCSPNTYLVEQL
jgi:hypothetical protein